MAPISNRTHFNSTNQRASDHTTFLFYTASKSSYKLLVTATIIRSSVSTLKELTFFIVVYYIFKGFSALSGFFEVLASVKFRRKFSDPVFARAAGFGEKAYAWSPFSSSNCTIKHLGTDDDMFIPIKKQFNLSRKWTCIAKQNKHYIQSRENQENHEPKPVLL